MTQAPPLPQTTPRLTTFFTVLFWALSTGYAVMIFLASHQPGSPDFSLPFAHADKVVHAVTYAGLWWLLACAKGGGFCPRGRTFRPIDPLPALGWPVVWASVYGMSDEFHQTFIPRRTADVWDWCADTAGALVAAMICRVFWPHPSA